VVERTEAHDPADKGERQEGTDRGDAERLSASRASEGVKSVAGNGPTPLGAIPGRKISETRRTSDRQRGATPAKPRWSKPSRQCETAKAERERTGGTVRPKESRKRLREWTPEPMSVGMTDDRAHERRVREPSPVREL
jgi:hypothetical protein